MSPYIAEFVGTFIFVLFIMSIIKQANKSKGSCEQFLVPLMIGLGLVISIYIAQSIGGNGHLNPAVSAAVAAGGNMTNTDLLYHVAAQILGGVCAYYFHIKLVQ
jgi:glycerol uptake facilitator-like aquaporin